MGLLLIGLRGIIADVIGFEVAIFLVIVGNGLRVEALRRELGQPSTLGRITLAYSLGWVVYAVLRNIAAIDAKVSFCWAALVIAAGFIRVREALAHLSPREREVRELLLQGYGNGEIVEALGISLETAKQYKSEVMRKMGARSLSQFMAINRTIAERAESLSR